MCNSVTIHSEFYILFVTEVEDTHHRMAFLDGGAVLNLPIFYLEGTALYILTFGCSIRSSLSPRSQSKVFNTLP